MISRHQLRAARGLLGWDRYTLAERSGVSVATLKNIETGRTQPHTANLEILETLFRNNGVEFIAARGVALVDEKYRLIEGEDCYLRLLDEIYHALRGTPREEVLSICIDDSVSPPEVAQAIQRWHDAGIRCRFLTHDQATRFDFPLHEYRLIPQRFFINSVMVVFADKVATLRGINGAVLVITDQGQADMLRGLFNLIWAQARPAKQARR